MEDVGSVRPETISIVILAHDSMTSMDGGNAVNAGSICSAMESCAGMTRFQKGRVSGRKPGRKTLLAWIAWWLQSVAGEIIT